MPSPKIAGFSYGPYGIIIPTASGSFLLAHWYRAKDEKRSSKMGKRLVRTGLIVAVVIFFAFCLFWGIRQFYLAGHLPGIDMILQQAQAENGSTPQANSNLQEEVRALRNEVEVLKVELAVTKRELMDLQLYFVWLEDGGEEKLEEGEYLRQAGVWWRNHDKAVVNVLNGKSLLSANLWD